VFFLYVDPFHWIVTRLSILSVQYIQLSVHISYGMLEQISLALYYLCGDSLMISEIATHLPFSLTIGVWNEYPSVSGLSIHVGRS